MPANPGKNPFIKSKGRFNKKKKPFSSDDRRVYDMSSWKNG